MAIKIGHASADERYKASGGEAGDQTGGEVCVRSWYSSPWDTVMRPKSAVIAEKSAKACEAACANNNIGYDQSQRNTLYNYAKAACFDLNEITDKCECDCSSLMHVCAVVGGANLKYGINGHTTWTLASALEASGDYEKLTDAKYLTSDRYLKRGDILINTDAHTAMALENGAGEATVPLTQGSQSGIYMSLKLPLLKQGSESDAVWTMQTMLTARGYDTKGADGEFGPNTLTALKTFQSDMGLEADGECGANTWTMLVCGK